MLTLTKGALSLFERCNLTTLILVLISIISLQAQARPNDPEIPAIERPVHLTDQGDHLRPIVPVYRTTRDGRLGYNVERDRDEGFKMFINSPENITTDFQGSPVGPTVLATATPFTVNPTRFRATTNGGGNVHTAVCEVPDANGNQRNPYACGDDDCYDLVFINAGADDPSRTRRLIQGTPGTVRVSNPKTPQARIESLTLGETVVNPRRYNFTQMWEPATTLDGNLLVARIDNTTVTWRNERTNTNVTGNYDMIYMAAPEDPSRACDVRQWGDMKPLGHAPYDPEINTRYGFATQLFRDAHGNVIPDNTDIQGTYPWVDSLGNNITFASFGTAPNFPVSCVPNRGCNDNNFSGNVPLMGKIVVGLWTQGKMVLQDSLVNNLDFSRPAQEDNGHRNLDMYRAGTNANNGGTGLTRVGGGRDTEGQAGLPANAENTTLQESIENKLNFWENMLPATPGDVVWHMSTGATSDEFKFDDYLYKDAVIISSMVQATTNNGRQQSQFGARGSTGTNNVDVRVQNAAASQRWNVPSHGRVWGTRVEPVALGGIIGKGVYHTNSSRIDYQMPSQPRNIRNNDWEISLFVDARFNNNNVVRSLINFPDGSELQLVGRDQARYWDDGDVLHVVDFPTAIPDNGWAHIGVQMSNRNRTATFYLNGYALNTFTSNRNFFEVHNGLLSVGDHATRNTPGFIGWIDEFKVIAQNTNPAEWCAHANGHLVGSNVSNGELADIASAYPASSHQEITDFLVSNGQQTYSYYACYHDYSEDYAGRKATIPAGFVPIKQSINFPEGPLVHNQPRPNSVNNPQCLQCHTADSPKGLGLDALTFNASLNAEDDPRRNPMQPVPRVFGHVPANYLGEDLPRTDMVAPAEGFPIDEALLPSGNSGPLWEGTPQTPQAAPAPADPSETIVHIRKRNALGFALDGANGAANGQSIFLWPQNQNNTNQRWIEIDRGNGFFSYRKEGTNHCIDGGRGGATRQDVYLWVCSDNNRNQHWLKSNSGSGFFQLIKRNAAEFAIDGGNGGLNGQNVQLYHSSTRSQNLQWRITPVN